MESVKNLYEKLSGKQLENENSVVSQSAFSSVLRDRFISELKKMGIQWNGEPTPLKDLGSQSSAIATAPIPSIPLPIGKSSSNILVGTDIQILSEFPVPSDYWTDTFYRDQFSAEEFAYALKKQNPLGTFAGIYSAKESIFKSNNNIQRSSIVISHENDAPQFPGYAISISHSGEYVVSVAIQLEKNNHNETFQKLSGELNLKNTELKKNQNDLKNQLDKIKRLVYISFLLSAALILFYFGLTWNNRTN